MSDETKGHKLLITHVRCCPEHDGASRQAGVTLVKCLPGAQLEPLLGSRCFSLSTHSFSPKSLKLSLGQLLGGLSGHTSHALWVTHTQTLTHQEYTCMCTSQATPPCL